LLILQAARVLHTDVTNLDAKRGVAAALKNFRSVMAEIFTEPEAEAAEAVQPAAQPVAQSEPQKPAQAPKGFAKGKGAGQQSAQQPKITFARAKAPANAAPKAPQPASQPAPQPAAQSEANEGEETESIPVEKRKEILSTKSATSGRRGRQFQSVSLAAVNVNKLLEQFK
jgi:hypothetical protein